jgi:CRISP-associated protein Cas1
LAVRLTALCEKADWDRPKKPNAAGTIAEAANQAHQKTLCTFRTPHSTLRNPKSMQLYLDSFGAYLSVRNGMFALRSKTGGEQLFAVRQVGAILLTAGTAMSTDAALLAASENIPLLLIDANTHAPRAHLSSGQAVSLAAIRRNQAIFSRNADGFIWVGGLLALKIGRQMALLESLGTQKNAPPVFLDGLEPALKTMSAQAKALQGWRLPEGATFVLPLAAERFRGQEGTASRAYFQQLGRYLHPDLGFEGRQGHPAYDPFNALLNYLYGMLYTSVHLAALKNGLDPYMAVLHADQYGAKPTLTYDMIEPYRPWADAVAITLAEDPELLSGDLFRPDPDDRGLWLSAAGKGKVIDAMLLFLKTPAAYQGRQLRRSAQIDLDAQKLAVFLKDYNVP